MTWIDISQTLTTTMPVWPGDPPYEVFRLLRMDTGDPCNLAAIRLSLHTGTHADAPRHFHDQGTTIDACPLDAFLGRARLWVLHGEGAIEPGDFARLPPETPERLLLSTGASPGAGEYRYLSEAAARALVDRGVKLVGMDTLSVDEPDSDLHPAHHVLADSGVVILENLELGGVGAGLYELVALPLKLAGLEASPVRAAIRFIGA